MVDQDQVQAGSKPVSEVGIEIANQVETSGFYQLPGPVERLRRGAVGDAEIVEALVGEVHMTATPISFLMVRRPGRHHPQPQQLVQP